MNMTPQQRGAHTHTLARDRRDAQRYDAWVLMSGTPISKWSLWFFGGSGLYETIATVDKLSAWLPEEALEGLLRVEIRDGPQVTYVAYDRAWEGKSYIGGLVGNMGGAPHFLPPHGQVNTNYKESST